MNDRPDQVERRNEGQIGVVTLMRLIWKWKVLIGSGIVVCALAALIISLVMPHVYKVDMLVENVQIGRNEAGDKVYLGNLEDIQALIKNGVFTQDILNGLRNKYGDTLPRKLPLRASIEKGKQFARVIYETDNVGMGKAILSQLFKRWQEKELTRIEYWKKGIDRKVDSKVDSKIAGLNKKISSIKVKINVQQEKWLSAETAGLAKMQEELSVTLNEKRPKEGLLDQLKEKRGSMISEMILHLNTEKKESNFRIRMLEEKDADTQSTIRLIENETNDLFKEKKDLLSAKSRSDFISVAGELSTRVMTGYLKLKDLGEQILNNKTSIQEIKWRILEIENELESLKRGCGKRYTDIVALNDSIMNVNEEIEELELKITELRDTSVLPVLSNYERMEMLKSKRETIATIKEDIAVLKSKKDKVKKDKVKNIILLQKPMHGIAPLKPDTKRNVIIGAVMGLLLSLFLAVFLEYVYKKDA